MNLRRISELLIVFIIGSLFGYWLNSIPKQKIPSTIEIKTDSIRRDSIFIVNDSIKTKIVYIKQKYEKEVSNIMSASDSSNYEFFRGYLENYEQTIKDY